MTDSEEYDVVVVGGGGSGLAAAVEAASAGKSVLVLEKCCGTGWDHRPLVRRVDNGRQHQDPAASRRGRQHRRVLRGPFVIRERPC